jgi:polyisoprenoid-binding protein YceI
MRVLALLASLATQAHAAPEEFRVEPSHTYPSFEVTHLGISTQRGRFERTGGRIVMDRDAGTGTIDITIEAGTVSTGNGLLDSVLRGEDFFDTARHPAIAFSAKTIEFDRGVPKRALGDLTLVGVKRPVELRVERFGCTRLPFFVRLTCGADVVANIKRSDFGMTSYAGLVGDEVRLEIQIEAVKLEPAAEPASAGG